MTNHSPYTIQTLQNAYKSGSLQPESIIDTIYNRIHEYKNYNCWIHTIEKQDVLARIKELKSQLNTGKHLALYGIPFAVKDNIDVAGISTTAACPDYSYVPEKNADVVQLLLDAGAILIGKTNLDQFATGLVGVRSPYGACKNAFDPSYISGGSSSGSAISVALGMVCFSLGTDTAGSGRIPAGFNNLIGLKPTIGQISTQGVVPACKSLDCVSIFSHTLEDASLVFDICTSYKNPIIDKAKSPRIAFPLAKDRFFVVNSPYKKLYQESINKIATDYRTEDISFDTFNQTAKLLYHGPWVAERMAAIKDFFNTKNESIHPVVRAIIQKATDYSATDTFEAMYMLEDLRKQAATIFETIDLMIVPTAPGIFTIEEVEKNPIELNTHLGYYTNYVNLLGLCALAIPAGFTSEGLPFGITLISTANNEKLLIEWAKRIQRSLAKDNNLTTQKQNCTRIAVAGLHKKNQPLNHQLTELSASYHSTCNTAPNYKMYLIESGKAKPGLIRTEQDEKGYAIEVELWDIPTSKLGIFMAQIPHPLGIGKIELEDSSWVYGFICEGYVAIYCKDISEYKSWENYLLKHA